MSEAESKTKIPSEYTRKEFLAREIEIGLDAQGIPGVDFAVNEPFDPDVLEAIKKRAEWNAQAAERAGVVWHTSPTDYPAADAPDPKWPFSWSRTTNHSAGSIDRNGHIRSLKGGVWYLDHDPHPAAVELARRLVAEYRSSSQIVGGDKPVAKSANEAWAKYVDSGACAVDEGFPRAVFNSGFNSGHAAGLQAAKESTQQAESVALEAEPGKEVDNRLQPCPFCGGNDLTEHRQEKYVNGIGWLSILCQSCGARGPEVKESVEVSVEGRIREVAKVESVWNSRSGIENSRKPAEAGAGSSAGSKFTDIEDEIEYLNSQLAELASTCNGELGRQRRSLETLEKHAACVDKRTIALDSRMAKVESEWNIQGQKYTADLRMTREQVTKTSQLIEQWQREVRECDAGLNNDRLKLEARVEKLESGIGHLEANVQGLLNSIGGAHSRLDKIDDKLRHLQGKKS